MNLFAFLASSEISAFTILGSSLEFNLKNWLRTPQITNGFFIQQENIFLKRKATANDI